MRIDKGLNHLYFNMTEDGELNFYVKVDNAVEMMNVTFTKDEISSILKLIKGDGNGKTNG